MRTDRMRILTGAAVAAMVFMLSQAGAARAQSMDAAKEMLGKQQYESAARVLQEIIQADPANQEAWRLYDYSRCQACAATVAGCEAMTHEKLTVTSQSMPQGIRVKDMQILASATSKFFIITGKVANGGGMTVNTLRITLNFLDENDMVATNAIFYVYGIKPGEEKPLFTAIRKVAGLGGVEAVGELE